MRSRRDDGRGHWPAGKRRNPDVVRWSRLRLRLCRLLDEHWQRGVISAAALADAVGVSRKTATNWLRGEDRPSPEHQQAIEAWVRERADQVKKRNDSSRIRIRDAGKTRVRG